MRSDMAKVIVERPRIAWQRQSRPKGYRRYLQKTGIDELPAREPMLGRLNGTKHFNEHLGPLRRFLRSQVGRPWNKVHSEICRYIRPDSVVQNHVLTHVWDYVAVNVVMTHGIPCFGESRRIGMPIRAGELYVCPHSGLLKMAKPRWRRSVRRRISIDESLQYHLVDGIWHEVRLRKLPPEFELCWDALLKKPIGKLPPAALWKAYGMAAYATSARALSKREAKTLLGKLK